MTKFDVAAVNTLSKLIVNFVTLIVKLHHKSLPYRNLE